MITFEWPWVFMLTPLPLLCYWLLKPAAISHEATLRTPFFGALERYTSITHRPTARHAGRLLLATLIWLLLIVSASRPSWVGEPVALPTEGRDLMLAVDISKSMERQDLTVNGQSVNRFAAVKSVLDDFISRRDTDRIGLILFGSAAYIQAPLTFDHKTLQSLLHEAYIGMAGPQTAIGDAIGFAVKRLKDQPAQNRVLVLLTDGANTTGALSPDEAAQLAQQIDLKVYTIGVGASEMRVSGMLGSILGPRTVNPSADLDEETLKNIAEMTGGQYFRAENTQALAKIYQELDRIEPLSKDPETLRPLNALFHWPLGIALLLSITWLIYILGLDRINAPLSTTDRPQQSNLTKPSGIHS